MCLAQRPIESRVGLLLHYRRQNSVCPRDASLGMFVVPASGRLFIASMVSPGAVANQASMIATALVHPADPPCTFTGKQLTMNPVAGNASRLCSFSTWQ